MSCYLCLLSMSIIYIYHLYLLSIISIVHDYIYSEEYILLEPKYVLPEFFMHVHFPLGEQADYAKKFDQQAIFNSNNALGSSLGILNLLPTAVDVINQTSSLTSSLSLHTNIFKQQQQQQDSNSNTTTSNTVGRGTSSKSEDNEQNDDDDTYTSSLFPLEDLFLSNSMYHITSNHSNHEYPKQQQQQSLLLRDNFCPTDRTTSINTTTYAAASTVTGIDNTYPTTINTNKNNVLNINSKNKVFNDINDNNNVNNDNNDYYTTHILSLGNNPRESLYRKQTIVESLHAFVQQFSIERNMYLQEYVNYLCRKFDIKIDDT